MASVENNLEVLDLIDDDADALSLRDFPIHEPDDEDPPCRSPSYHDLFEFCTDLKQRTSSSSPPSEIVFCGKILEPGSLSLRDKDSDAEGRSFRSNSESFMRNQSFRSKSFSTPVIGSFGYQRSSLRRPMALIGLTRTPSRTELSEIRRRQARLAPAPMFRVVPGDAAAATVAADGTGGEMSPWSLIRALRYRSVLVRVLAKAASSCITRA